MSDTTDFDTLVDILDANIQGHAGMSWYPNGAPTEKAFLYAQAIEDAGFHRD